MTEADFEVLQLPAREHQGLPATTRTRGEERKDTHTHAQVPEHGAATPQLQAVQQCLLLSATQFVTLSRRLQETGTSAEEQGILLASRTWGCGGGVDVGPGWGGATWGGGPSFALREVWGRCGPFIPRRNLNWFPERHLGEGMGCQ